MPSPNIWRQTPQGIPATRHRRVSFWALFPALATFFISTGVATALVIWLYTQRITEHPAEEDHLFRNAIVVLEGDRSKQSSLYGLSISSVASTVIPICAPFLMGAIGYVLAAHWTKQKQMHIAPTPEQYALLLKMCGSASPFSVYETTRYIARSRSESQVSSLLRRSFIALLTVLGLSYGVAITDFWLHTAASSFVHTSLVSSRLGDPNVHHLPDRGFAINTTSCPSSTPTIFSNQASKASFPFPKDYNGPRVGPITKLPGAQDLNRTNCLATESLGASQTNTIWGTPDMFRDAVRAASNNSAIASVHILQADVSGKLQTLAVAIPAVQRDSENSVSPSYGVHVDCNAVTDCVKDPDGTQGMTNLVICPQLDPPINITMADKSVSGQADILLPFNASTKALLRQGYQENSDINPFGAMFFLNYPSRHGEQSLGFNTSEPGWYHIGRGAWSNSDDDFFIASCTLTFYELNVSSSFGRYTIQGEIRKTDYETTSALLAAYFTSLSSELLRFLHNVMYTSANTPTTDLLEYLAGNVSIASLGMALPVLQPASASLITDIYLKTASRYPLPALITFLLLAYAFGFLALVFALWAWSTAVGVGVMEAQSFLTNSSTVVMHHFDTRAKGSPLRTYAGGVQRVEVGPLEIEGEDEDNTIIGLRLRASDAPESESDVSMRFLKSEE